MSELAAEKDRRDFRLTYYDRQVARLVQAIRDLADQVEREGVPYEKAGITGTPRYLNAAEQVNHALTWGVANAGAYRLMDAAYHADAAEVERATRCGGCQTCLADVPAHPGSWLTVPMTRMILCPECGNKRCPKASDHRLDCTGSNEPGQAGSVYGGAA